MKKVRVLDIITYILFVGAIVVIGVSFGVELHAYFVYAAWFVVGITLIIVLYSKYVNKLRNEISWLEKRVKLGNSISYRIKVAGEKSFNDMPLGIIVYNNEYRIEWANQYAKSIFMSTLIERKFVNISKELDVQIKSLSDFNIEIYGKEYNVLVLKEDNIIFLTDKTDLKKLQKKYFERTQASGIISLDNFEEALSAIDAQERALKVSDIIGILSDWSEKYGIYIRGYSEKQYLVLMDRMQLEKIITDEFNVIDDVNDYCVKENLRITVSIGVACFDTGIIELMDKSNELLELALNRGGNQAVVFVDDNIKYYGGKVKGVDNRLPIYVRVKTEDLKDLILTSENVIVMAHTNIDADAFGASIGAAKIVRALKKPCHVVFNYEVADATVKEVFDDIQAEHIGMLDYFVTPNKALTLINENTLLIICDCQYQKLLIDERVYKRAKKIAIIDHHRSNSSAISNHNYLYNKTTSSSSVELIVEMFDFIDEEINMSNIEATLMLLGIIVDTSNLMYRTSYQTFNVLSKLQLYGAEMPKVQRFLREDYDMYVKRMNILNNVEIFNGIYGIAVCDENEIFSRQFIAKVADNIILVDVVKAGFCIGKIDDEQIGISARSLDEENVQLIMEIMGGGGHFNNAATQITGITVEEAKQRLIDILKEQEKTGGETMKIILIKDVKGKGKEGDVIDIPSGHANYLIRSKMAVLATPDNLNELKRQNEIEKKEAQDHLEEMRELKEFIEKNTVTIAVRVGKEGKLFGTVSTKQIVDEIKNEYDIILDKRKIVYEKEIDALGTYLIPIQLHKEVIATITLHVIEKTDKR